MNTMQKILVIGFMMIACSASYYLLVTLPSIEQSKLELMKEKEAKNEAIRQEKEAKKEALRQEKYSQLLHCRAGAEKELIAPRSEAAERAELSRKANARTSLRERQMNLNVPHNSGLLAAERVTIRNRGYAECTKMYGEK